MTIEHVTVACPNCGKHDAHITIIPLRDEEPFYCVECKAEFYWSDCRRPTYPGSYEYNRAEMDG